MAHKKLSEILIAASWIRFSAVTLCCSISAALLIVGVTSASAQSKKIAVNWDDPAIQKFTQRAKVRSLGVKAPFDPRLTKLKLPVLGFEKPIPKVRSAFGLSPPPAIRSLTMDESNPVWYEISYDYGEDIKITIEADLRIQTKLAPGAKIYAGQGDASLDQEISVSDATNEVGMIGSVAEFKVYRFGQVPYAVTIECSEKKKAFCQDVEGIKRDRKFLRLIEARPPKK